MILNMELVNVGHVVNVSDSMCMLKMMHLLVIMFVLSSLEQMDGGYCTRTIRYCQELIFIQDPLVIVSLKG